MSMASLGRNALRRTPGTLFRRHFSSDRTIKELDVLYLRQSGDKWPRWHLTKPLEPGARVKLAYGASIPASDLIGRNFLDTICDSKGHKVTLHEATLATYIVNSERTATPIYPHDASAIVALLDLNLPRPGELDDDADGDAPPFEVFEAGTGMGSLTMHISRAMHAANPPTTALLRRHLATAALRSQPKETTETSKAGKATASSEGAAVDARTSEETALEGADETVRADNSDSNGSPVDVTAIPLHLHPDGRSEWEAYRASRRAVLHTLDNRWKHVVGAFNLVRTFNKAMYLPNIEFHAGSIDNFINARLAQTGDRPFLSRAILDLPQSEDHAASVVRALRTNALLVLFKPSISQVASFQAWALETGQPLRLEKVIELPVSTNPDGGMHNASGGREWDVKMVRPRAHSDRRVQVMRPKVGDRVAGGGFVAVFRRWPDEGPAEVLAEEETDEA